MKKSELLELIKEVLEEESATGAVGGYSTPFAFSKKGQGKNTATKATEKLGYKTVERPKRPSHTKMFDYLDEHGGAYLVTPNAFTSEAGMYDQDAVKYMEKQGMKVIGKPKNLSKKTLATYSDKKNR
jgi:hypothetical protein